jgi:hypothetical protein
VESLQITDLVAIWGAALSTLLACVKLWEMWIKRSRIEVSYNFTGNEDVGNEIILRNLSATPLLITWWELMWQHRRWLRWKDSKRISPDEFFNDLVLKAHSSSRLSFQGPTYFDWSHGSLGRNSIYIRLHIAGRSRPAVFKVYDSRS